jgi:hypothetical protein
MRHAPQVYKSTITTISSPPPSPRPDSALRLRNRSPHHSPPRLYVSLLSAYQHYSIPAHDVPHLSRLLILHPSPTHSACRITHLFSAALSPGSSALAWAAALHPPPLLALHSPPSPSGLWRHLYLDLGVPVPVSSPRASSRLWSSSQRPLRELVLRDPWPGALRGSIVGQHKLGKHAARHDWQ